jgi:hypothetical protein
MNEKKKGVHAIIIENKERNTFVTKKQFKQMFLEHGLKV